MCKEFSEGGFIGIRFVSATAFAAGKFLFFGLEDFIWVVVLVIFLWWLLTLRQGKETETPALDFHFRTPGG